MIFLCFLKKLYKELENRIDLAIEMGKIPKETRDQHIGFSEWNSKVTKQDHQSIVQVIFVFLFIIKFNFVY
jgi:hypothetical protein